MKNFLIKALLIVIANTAFAQKPDKALIRVKYAFSHMRDTTKRQDFYKEDMVLIAGKNASVFLSYDKIMRDIERNKSFQEQNAQPEMMDGVRVLRAPPRGRPTLGTEQYYFASEDKFFTLEPMGINYLVERKPEKINWKILPETVKLEGITCKKATASVGGRNWTVWFAEDMPFTTGPWKLIGLPGLILQAQDDKNEVMFGFAGIEKIDASSVSKRNDNSENKSFGTSGYLTNAEISLPTNAVKTSAAELKRLIDFSIKDPQGFAKAQVAAMGMANMKPVAGQNITPPRSIAVINNPLDKINSF